MITGIIVAVICIAVLPPAISKGEWGVVAVAAVIILLLLGLGSAGREQDRAYVNRIRYWANGGPERHGRGHGR